MIQRIWVLTTYFTKSTFFSLAGLILLLLSLVYWAVLFPIGQSTPDLENYVILVGALGAAACFTATLLVSSRAGRAENLPFLARLPSRVEYLASVTFSALIIGVVLQLLVALLASIRGPEISVTQWLILPPVWLSVNIAVTVLALHATDLVADGWSRVVVFGILAFLLVVGSAGNSSESWLAERIYDMSSLFVRVNLIWFADVFAAIADWMSGNSVSALSGIAGFVFWPVTSITDALFAGAFSRAQALAPAVLVLYGSILFLIAAGLFAGKDLEFVE